MEKMRDAALNSMSAGLVMSGVAMEIADYIDPLTYILHINPGNDEDTCGYGAQYCRDMNSSEAGDR